MCFKCLYSSTYHLHFSVCSARSLRFYLGGKQRQHIHKKKMYHRKMCDGTSFLYQTCIMFLYKSSLLTSPNLQVVVARGDNIKILLVHESDPFRWHSFAPNLDDCGQDQDSFFLLLPRPIPYKYDLGYVF